MLQTLKIPPTKYRTSVQVDFNFESAGASIATMDFSTLTPNLNKYGITLTDVSAFSIELLYVSMEFATNAQENGDRLGVFVTFDNTKMNTISKSEVTGVSTVSRILISPLYDSSAAGQTGYIQSSNQTPSSRAVFKLNEGSTLIDLGLTVRYLNYGPHAGTAPWTAGLRLNLGY